MLSRRLTAILGATAVGLLAGAIPAAASGGEIGGSGSQYHLTNGWEAKTDLHFTYGRQNDAVYVGDWDGDGIDTLAVRRSATYHFRNELSGGDADEVTTYGRRNDVVIMGDWDGDGKDTPAVRRGATYHIKNDLEGGNADRVVTYGKATDTVVVGDWDGDGKDTLGVRRGSVYHLKNDLEGGDADHVVNYGRRTDEVYVGDWNGNGRDTLAIRRGSVFHAKNSIAGGNADFVMNFGRASDAVLVGDWDGNGSDTIGLRTSRSGPSQGMSSFDARMIRLINAERADAGVPAVRAWSPLRDGAVRHSRWMARTGTFEHASSNTIREDGRRAGCDASAENIAWGSEHYAEDPAGLMEGYMNSPGHRANILDPDNRFVAVGSVQADNGRVYNTQRFARSCS